MQIFFRKKIAFCFSCGLVFSGSGVIFHQPEEKIMDPGGRKPAKASPRFPGRIQPSKDEYKKMKSRFLLFLIWGILPLTGGRFAFESAGAAEDGGILIERSSRKANPTLVFGGVAGDNELSRKVKSNLMLCGWFDVQSGGNSDYRVSGIASGDTLTLTLSNGAGLKIRDFTVRASGAALRADTAVDKILNELFGIPGICRTKIAFVAEVAPSKRDICVCGFDGSAIERVTSNHSLSVEPVWMPDGRGLVYCYYGPSYTALIQYRFDLRKSRRLTRYNGLNAGGELSPDGRYVALVLGRGNQVDLYLRPTEGGSLIRLTHDKAVEASPAWTPDGRKICYVSDANGRPQLYLIDPFRRGAPVRLPNLRGSERVTPDFAPDGTLAYSAKVGGSYLITIASMKDPLSPHLEAIGAGEGKLIPGEGPSWAPDGRHIVIAEQGVLYVVDTRLGKKRRLLRGPSRTFQPDWSPILTRP